MGVKRRESAREKALAGALGSLEEIIRLERRKIELLELRRKALERELREERGEGLGAPAARAREPEPGAAARDMDKKWRSWIGQGELMVAFHLRKGYSPEGGVAGMTPPLILAARAGELGSARLLLEAGADPSREHEGRLAWECLPEGLRESEAARELKAAWEARRLAREVGEGEPGRRPQGI